LFLKRRSPESEFSTIDLQPCTNEEFDLGSLQSERSELRSDLAQKAELKLL